MANPYSRLPVDDQAMFVGRSQDLLQIDGWLRTGCGLIWLLGQKRVGKSSLLLQLRNSYRGNRGFVPVFVDFQLLGDLATDNLFFEIANAVYGELQTDPRIGDVGAPLPALFAHRPPMQFITYLRSIQSRLGANRLLLLLDEFSRTGDACARGDLAPSFFADWRGVLQTLAPAVCTVSAVQQHAGRLAEQHTHDPSRHLPELGETLILKPLNPQDARRLIEWPMRNCLAYTPGTVDSVARLTGGSPFLIQAFCSKLSAHMAHQDRRRVEMEDIDAVRAEFMQPGESVFAHFMQMIRGNAQPVAYQLARLAGAGAAVKWDALRAALPHYAPDTLRRTLAALAANDILIRPSADQWAFASLLFQEWLELNLA